MLRARDRLVLALLIALPTSARAEAPPFHTEPTAGGEHAVIVESRRREAGDLLGFAAIVERVGPAGRQRQRYDVQCERSYSAPPGVSLIRGGAAQHIAVQPGHMPAAGERFAYNLWWAVCRGLLQRY